MIRQNRPMALFFAFFLLAPVFGCAQERPDWDNPRVTRVNTEEPHTTMMVFPSREESSLLHPERSPWYHSLNAPWQFKWVKRPQDRPGHFCQTDYKLRHLDRISVPTNLEVDSWSERAYPLPPFG
jgi:beta-galactosidase